MKQADYLNPKANFDIRKRPINAKLFQNQKTTKEEFILNTKKNMGKKYMQQPNIFKQRQDQPKKQHRQIVMSQQFIRSSKLYRLLRQKMDRCDSIFIKQVNSTNQHKMKLKQEIMQVRSQNYQQKVSLWQLKNKLMELKIMYHEQEQQSKRLGEQNVGEYEGEQEYEGQNENDNQDINNEQNEQEQKQNETGKINEIGYLNNENSLINNIIQKEQEQQEQKLMSQQNKSQFTQILQQLMNLKAQRQKMQKELSEQQIRQQNKYKKQNSQQQIDLNYNDKQQNHYSNNQSEYNQGEYNSQ